jgi:hypothetical protein
MKKMILILFGLLLFLPVLPVIAGNNHEADAALAQKEAKSKRDTFYGDMENRIKFKKTDIKAVRDAGYSPLFAAMMLFIAKEGNVPVSELIEMRAAGKCWGEMCSAIGLNYEVVEAKFEAVILANDIKFPFSSGGEHKADITYGRSGASK